MTGVVAEVEALVRAGRHADAAELFAAVWQWPRAVEAALRAGRPDRALAHALTARDDTLLERVRSVLSERPEAAVRGAEQAERTGHAEEAGRLWERAGEPTRAAAAYAAAGSWLEAGRCHESEGRYAEAGRCYERRVRQAPWDGEASLRLGRLLAQFGRHEAAARALQEAERDPRHRAPARRLLIACFDALGMDHAAAACLDRLRETDPAAAPTVGSYLGEAFGDRRGLVALRKLPREELLAGRYRVVRSLGAGGTGRVLLAQDVFLDRQVAIKVLAVGSGVGGRDALARFEREARLAASLDHPNVVRVHQYHPEGPFMVMELMDGGTLEERLAEARRRGRTLPRSQARRIVDAVLAGLDAVHRRGVVHRDLKSANVFFGARGEVKIGDFGVAHLMDLGATRTGAMLGTLATMAPEQITGAELPSAATDLYAVGVLLFEMLTGELPYRGPDVVSQHLDAPVPRPGERAPWLGDRYDALVQSLLAKAPSDRPGGARAVAEAIAALDWPEEAGGRVGGTGGAPDPEEEGEGEGRYVPLAGERELHRDTLLGRTVRVLACDRAACARWRWAGAVDDPHLQAVLDVEPETGRVVLEVPAGEPWPRAGLSPEGDAARRAHEQVRGALERLHRAGRAHGAIAADRVVVGPGRAVLLWPEEGPDPRAPAPRVEEERAALGRIFARNGGKQA